MVQPYPKSHPQIKVTPSILLYSIIILFSSDKSTNNNRSGNSGSEYLAADMYDYDAFSYYEIETTMTKYRLPQPSSYAPLKPPEPAPQKK